MTPLSPAAIVSAHQYLYYVLAVPIWDDYDYDLFCHAHGIPGGGGSDCESHYTDETRALAALMRAEPAQWSPRVIEARLSVSI